MTQKTAENYEPIIDPKDPFSGLDALPDLKGFNLAGIYGGKYPNNVFGGDDNYQYIREYEDGDDASKIDPILTIENPDHTPMVRIYSANIRPRLWVATDMLKTHQDGQDVYYDKRGLALSAVYSLLKTALRRDYQIPTAVIAANDREIYNSGHPKTGTEQLLDLTDNLQALTDKQHGLVSIEEQPNLSGLLKYVGYAALRSIVVVVSDFRGAYVYPDDPQDNWQAELNTIVNQGNALIAIEVTSPEDLSIPQYIHNIRHSPHGRAWAGKDGKRFREAYCRITERQTEKIAYALGSVGAMHVRLKTDNPQWFSSLNAQLVDAEKRI